MKKIKFFIDNNLTGQIVKSPKNRKYFSDLFKYFDNKIINIFR